MCVPARSRDLCSANFTVRVDQARLTGHVRVYCFFFVEKIENKCARSTRNIEKKTCGLITSWAERLGPGRPKNGRYCGPRRYLGSGRYLGLMDECFSRVSAQYVSHKKNTCTCMHIPYTMYSDVSLHPPPPPPERLHGRGRVKLVDMLYLDAYMEGGRYFGWALFGAFTVIYCYYHIVFNILYT